jgi:hypothetical protein
LWVLSNQVKAEFILPFDDTNKEVYGKEKKIRGFNEAMLEIQTNPGLKVDGKRKENADNKLVVCILCDYLLLYIWGFVFGWKSYSK